MNLRVLPGHGTIQGNKAGRHKASDKRRNPALCRALITLSTRCSSNTFGMPNNLGKFRSHWMSEYIASNICRSHVDCINTSSEQNWYCIRTRLTSRLRRVLYWHISREGTQFYASPRWVESMASSLPLCNGYLKGHHRSRALSP